MPLFRHAERTQRLRRADRPRQRRDAGGSIGDAERPGDLVHRLGNGRRIVGQRVRQHDRVGLGMRQVEQAAQRVAKLVVQRHADRAEAGAGKQGAILRVGARLAVALASPTILGSDRPSARDALLGQQR